MFALLLNHSDSAFSQKELIYIYIYIYIYIFFFFFLSVSWECFGQDHLSWSLQEETCEPVGRIHDEGAFVSNYLFILGVVLVLSLLF